MTVHSQKQNTTTILLAEDDVFIRLDAAQFLKAEGFAVLEARHADEALSLLKSHPVDLVFTDVDMPGSTLDGLQLAQTIRHAWPAIPVLVTSGKVIVSAGEAPAFGFIPKPYRADDIIAWIRKALPAA